MSISDRMKRMHNCVGISIDSEEGFSGKLYNCYETEPRTFNDADEFFNIVNAFLDALEFPAQKFKYRAFKKTLPTLIIVDIDPKEKLYETKDLLSKVDEKGFILMVAGRDNATWQGEIYNTSSDEEYSFNSEVELIRFLNK